MFHKSFPNHKQNAAVALAADQDIEEKHSPGKEACSLTAVAQRVQAGRDDARARQSQQLHEDLMTLQGTAGNYKVAQLFARDREETAVPATQLPQPSEAINGISFAENEAVRQLTGGQVDLHLSGASLQEVNPGDSRLTAVNARSMTSGRQALVGVRQDRGHEIWHLAQQAQKRVKPTTTINNQPLNNDTSLEKEADQMGAQINQANESLPAAITAPDSQSTIQTSPGPEAPIQRKLVNNSGDIVDILPNQEEHPNMSQQSFKKYKHTHRDRIAELDAEIRAALNPLLQDKQAPPYLEQLIWNTMRELHEVKQHRFDPKAVARKIMKNINYPADLAYPISDNLSSAISSNGKGLAKSNIMEAEQLAKLFAVAIESVKDLNELTEAMAVAGGGRYETVLRPFPGIKSMSRAAFKGVIKKGSNYALLGDILASSIIYDNVEELAQALPRIQSFVQQINYLQVKGFKNRFAQVSPQGYRDILMNFTLPSGHIAEIQLHIKNMINAKKEGHKYYEDERTVSELYEFVEEPLLNEIKTSLPKGLTGQEQQVKSMASHTKRIRQGGNSGLGLSPSAAHWKLQSANQAQIQETESISSAKVQFIKDLQQAAKSDVYAKAWLKEVRDYKQRNKSFAGLNATLREIEAFKLKDQGKAQNIDADYEAMFGSKKLLEIHRNLLVEAHKEIAENKELVFGLDWQKLSILPQSQFV